MFRHVVLLRWKPNTPDAARRAVHEGLSQLPGAIPQIRHYHFGDDAGLAEGNYDLAVVADFDDAADYQIYAAHPRHQEVIAERIRPHLEARVAVQYEVV